MTLKERVIVSAYTGYLMVQGEELKYLYEYAEKVTGRKGWQTIDFAEAELLQNRAKYDFIKLCSDYSPFNNEDFDRLEKAITNDAELNSRCSMNTLPGGQREICLWGRSEEGVADLIEALREYARGLALWKQEFTEKDGFRVGYISPIRGLISPEEVFKRWKEKVASQ